MKDFLKNVLANITAILILCGVFFIFIMMMIAVSSAFEDGKAKVKENSVLVFDMDTRILESPTDSNDDFFNLNPEKKEVLAYNVIKAIQAAKTDDRIKGISIEADWLQAGITQVDDIRAALEDFKKSGKFVYAYGNSVSQTAYYLGSVAQKYYLNPAGGIQLSGLSTEVTYLKDFLDKYGIGMEVLRHGKYKAAVEPLFRNDMSTENREQLSTLLNDIWSNTSKSIMASRKIDSAQFRLVVDSLYSMIPENNIKYHLVDKLAQQTEYENMLKGVLKQDTDDKLRKVSVADYVTTLEQNNAADEVAVLYASGDITNGDDYEGIQSRTYVKEIQKLQKKDNVKAVVLRVNSPGGSANAADEILFELKQLRAKKPVVVSFGDYAASGGYYIAMAGDKIFTGKNTVTGSIGVFGVIPNAKELANRNGLHSEEVTTNASSNAISFWRGLAPGAKNMLTKSIEATYRRFVGFVMENRKKTFQEVDNIGGGRVWAGSRAKAIGLADETGTLQDAVNYAAKKAGLKEFDVAAYPKKKSKFEQLFKDLDEEAVSNKMISRKIGKENLKIFEMLFSGKPQEKIMMQFPVRVRMN